MTQDERIELAHLRSEMNEGFRELRSLIETRRIEDHSAHAALYKAIADGDGAADTRLRWVEKIAVVAVAISALALAFGPSTLEQLLS